MSIIRCARIIHIEPPSEADEADYFLLRHRSGFWMILKNTIASEKFQTNHFYEALHFANANARVRGRSLWISLDYGNQWHIYKQDTDLDLAQAFSK